MKKWIGLISFLFIMTNLYSQEKDNLLFKSKDSVGILVEYRIVDSNIDSILNLIITQNHPYLQNDHLLILWIEKDKNDTNNYLIEIVIYNKQNFNYISQRYNYYINGFLTIQGYPVLILGGFYSNFFVKTENKKKFDFLFKLKNIPKDYPPSISDPPFFDYQYKNGVIESINLRK